MDILCLNGTALMEVGIWSRKFCRQWYGCGKQHVQSRLSLRCRHSSWLSVCSFQQSFKVHAVAPHWPMPAIQVWHIHSQPQPMNREASLLPSPHNTLIMQQTSPQLTLPPTVLVFYQLLNFFSLVISPSLTIVGNDGRSKFLCNVSRAL